jgi:putative membrane protein
LPAVATKLTDALRGVLMGCAEVVPGVSGGTIALILGIYDRLLLAIRALFSAVPAAVRLDKQAARARLAEVEWGLLVPLLAGMAVALLTAAAVIPGLLDRYPEESSALFFGLILASLVVPWRMWTRRRAWHVGVLVAAALLAFVLTGLPEREITDPSYALVFVAAALAICAFTLPGVSGSYLLLALGLYAPTLEAVDGRDLGYIAVFAAGALVGLAAFARLLVRLLGDHRDVTVVALLGLMVGSLRALWPWSTPDGTLLAPPDEASAVLSPVLMATCGIVIVAALLWTGRARGDGNFADRDGVRSRAPRSDP